ncbi:hypothetical protein RJ640_009658 [Escallonia rubra]|uniref:HMG box domain-containing protein n=1 Tax=Escallonia rubra TaxID=112253 RepID=A0AA88U4E2_9ASTE|nr:hypothetical protein RJ640_009658 [Escallonia rubra]
MYQISTEDHQEIKDKRERLPRTQTSLNAQQLLSLSSCNGFLAEPVCLSMTMTNTRVEEFRKTFKEEHPGNKSVATVAKEGGEKWKSLTDEEKKPYQARAAELKAEYEKVLEEAEKADNEDVSFYLSPDVICLLHYFNFKAVSLIVY